MMWTTLRKAPTKVWGERKTLLKYLVTVQYSEILFITGCMTGFHGMSIASFKDGDLKPFSQVCDSRPVSSVWLKREGAGWSPVLRLSAFQ